MAEFNVEFDKQTILIVDDQPNNLKILSSVLGDKYRLYIANSGEKALKILEMTHPDIILLDIMMPEMDGFEVCKRIKSNSRLESIPIIFLTAKNSIDDIIKGFELGAVDYIIKPFNILEVKARIDTHLKLYAALDKINEQKRELEEINAELIQTQIEMQKRNEDLSIAHEAVEAHAHSVNVLNIKLLESEHKIKQINQELLKANKEKDKFFSIIAHDLKSPFSGFLGLLQLLHEENKSFSEEEKRGIILQIFDSSKNLFTFLENLLDWSRLQRGVIKFEPENIALRTLVDFNIQLNRANTSIKQIKINNEVPEELNVFADRQMLSTVIRNLISNSVKFSYKSKKRSLKNSFMRESLIELEIDVNKKAEFGAITLAAKFFMLGIFEK